MHIICIYIESTLKAAYVDGKELKPKYVKIKNINIVNESIMTSAWAAVAAACRLLNMMMGALPPSSAAAPAHHVKRQPQQANKAEHHKEIQKKELTTYAKGPGHKWIVKARHTMLARKRQQQLIRCLIRVGFD